MRCLLFIFTLLACYPTASHAGGFDSAAASMPAFVESRHYFIIDAAAPAQATLPSFGDYHDRPYHPSSRRKKVATALLISGGALLVAGGGLLLFGATYQPSNYEDETRTYALLFGCVLAIPGVALTATGLAIFPYRKSHRHY